MPKMQLYFSGTYEIPSAIANTFVSYDMAFLTWGMVEGGACWSGEHSEYGTRS